MRTDPAAPGVRQRHGTAGRIGERTAQRPKESGGVIARHARVLTGGREAPMDSKGLSQLEHVAGVFTGPGAGLLTA